MLERLAGYSLESLAQKFLSKNGDVPEQNLRMDLDEYYTILSNPRRRHVVRYMGDFSEENPFELGDISKEIAALENGKDADRVTSSERKNVYVGLYQSHLTKLDKAEVVDYEQERGIVDFGPKFDLIDAAVGDQFYEPREDVTWEELG